MCGKRVRRIAERIHLLSTDIARFSRHELYRDIVHDSVVSVRFDRDYRSDLVGRHDVDCYFESLFVSAERSRSDDVYRCCRCIASRRRVFSYLPYIEQVYRTRRQLLALDQFTAAVLCRDIERNV